MAEVWLAEDDELGRQVVVKLLAPEADRDRFEREARAVAALSHPNIVQLFDFGAEERWYMVFEYLRGGSLEERLAEVGVLPVDEVARIAGDVATGLAHAHSRGVVHRDLKPGNVLFDMERRSKIADFGIARVQGVDTLTEDGTVLGTAAYISPEQVRGEPVTPASDVYAFGVILYRLLAGRLPFEADSPMQLAALHRDAEPPPLPTTSDDDPSRVLAAVAMSAIAKEPSGRPVDGAALVRSLKDRTLPAPAATTEVIHAAVPMTGRARRRVLVAGVVAAFVLAGCGAVAAMLLTNNPASAPAVTGPKQLTPHTATTTSPSIAQTTRRHSPTTTTRQSIPTTTARPTTAPRTTTPEATTAATTVPPTTTAPTTAVSTQTATTPATTTPTP
jgi:serine/threonine-protein kinase